MQVIVRDNKNIETVYNFEPGANKVSEASRYYANLYMTLQIQGYQIVDETGRTVKFGGSI
jgi:hypothetical protein